MGHCCSIIALSHPQSLNLIRISCLYPRAKESWIELMLIYGSPVYRVLAEEIGLCSFGRLPFCQPHCHQCYFNFVYIWSQRSNGRNNNARILFLLLFINHSSCTWEHFIILGGYLEVNTIVVTTGSFSINEIICTAPKSLM